MPLAKKNLRTAIDTITMSKLKPVFSGHSPTGAVPKIESEVYQWFRKWLKKDENFEHEKWRKYFKLRDKNYMYILFLKVVERPQLNKTKYKQIY